MRLAQFLFPLFLGACGIFGSSESEETTDGEGGADVRMMSENEFIEAYITVSCDADEECEPSYFYDYYKDVEECYDLREDDVDEYWDSSGCDFDPEAAQECVDNVERYLKSCGEDALDDAEDVCDDVYDCD